MRRSNDQTPTTGTTNRKQIEVMEFEHNKQHRTLLIQMCVQLHSVAIRAQNVNARFDASTADFRTIQTRFLNTAIL